MTPGSRFAVSLALMPFAALADGDYFGTLKPPQSSLSPPGAYSFATGLPPAASAAASDNGYRLKLGYKYSRFFAVAGEYVDFKRADPFTAPASLASSFRSTGFGVDTIAMLPLWRFSLYGRMGAYRGDARGGFENMSTALLPDSFTRATRWRYGMGVRYDFTPSLGVRAEVERHSPLGSPLATELDAADQFSVGLSWRF
ncbi:MAG TPA: outer membrane beta-barrel protein [Usitatibacter sp.]|nr:outer membrane beta-barrel protein [Usitatibacter sp.]